MHGERGFLESDSQWLQAAERESAGAQAGGGRYDNKGAMCRLVGGMGGPATHIEN